MRSRAAGGWVWGGRGVQWRSTRRSSANRSTCDIAKIGSFIVGILIVTNSCTYIFHFSITFAAPKVLEDGADVGV